MIVANSQFRDDAEAHLELVARVVNESEHDLTSDEIAQALRRYGLEIPGRTLRRHLGKLARNERIRTIGERRGRKYRRIAPDVVPHSPERAEGDESYPPLSPAGNTALARIRRPRATRELVGYNATFLERYEPAHTWYLGASDRERLSEIGSTDRAKQPAGTFARAIHDRLLIDLSWASSHLEGNTYSLLDTERLLANGLRAEGKDAAETQMILNHKAAIELLVENAADIEVDRRTLLSLHALLAENLLATSADEGRLRTHPVAVGASTFTPLNIPQRLEECFDLLLAKAREIPDPFEQSFFLMVQLPYLQPFADVNKRTSRLAANIPLIKHNLVPLSFVDVSPRAYTDGMLCIYETNDIALLRDIFVWAYERSSRLYQVIRESLGEPDPFRLQHRTALHNTIRDVILGKTLPSVQNLLHMATLHGVPERQREQFATVAMALLENVSEGASGRYRVTPSQYRAWAELYRSQ